MYYISTDATLTTANLHSALASLSDDEVRHVLGGRFDDSREQRITNWIMMHYCTSWEFVAGQCFHYEKEKALEEVKKHFKRKLGMLSGFHLKISVWGGSGCGIFTHHCTVLRLPLILL